MKLMIILLTVLAVGGTGYGIWIHHAKTVRDAAAYEKVMRGYGGQVVPESHIPKY